ncbi:PREDICTED: GFP-like fluorescent chromoprotein dsFP483 [Branchiostoma belcheri]|uniref:GFP-like fluorescent chromoprotein dsFP483 n=1 Tax=Branchiostoma belcheri TaxID=7741 RepID=A0A6P5A5W4_BRABE|nr:PREDICTED: GFP-like fluorescent chromoprotein dsFP483 [Branchiostoma belcheri]
MQSLPTTHDCHIFGTINGHAFDMVGGGSGNPKDGSLQTTVRSTKGPLPFSGVILGPNLGYGYHQYLPFPSGKSPYQNAIKNGGYEKHRTFHFEDGGVMSINFRYTYEGNKIKGEFHVVGSGFPDDGPVMTNSVQAHDNNVERLQVLGDRTIGSDNVWTFTGKGKGDTYNANVMTNATFAQNLQPGLESIMPLFVFRKVDIQASKTEITLVEREKVFSDLCQ